MACSKVLRLQRSWWYYRHEGSLELGSMIRQARLRLSGDTEELEALLAALEAGVPADTASDELSRRCGLHASEIEPFLDTLKARGALIVTEPIRSDPNDIYDRQARFFDMFETEVCSGAGLNHNLRERKVLIVGLGGYGTQLAQLCSRIGIRRIVGIDPDRVELTNLSRQVLYTRADVGELKIDACKRSLSQVDPELEFEGHAVWIKKAEDLAPYMDGVDFVFNTFGYPPSPDLESVAKAAGEAGVPHLLLGGSWVGPLTVPGETPCYWCLMAHPDFAGTINISMGRFMIKTSTQPMGGVFAPRIAAATGVAVWEAARYLSGMDRPPSLDGVLALDLFSQRRSAFLPVPRIHGCPVCSGWGMAASTSLQTDAGV